MDKKEEENPARILMVTLALGVPEAPTDETKRHILTSFIRVAQEGMKLEVIQAQLLVLTEDQVKQIAEAPSEEVFELAGQKRTLQ